MGTTGTSGTIQTTGSTGSSGTTGTTSTGTTGTSGTIGTTGTSGSIGTTGTTGTFGTTGTSGTSGTTGTSGTSGTTVALTTAVGTTSVPAYGPTYAPFCTASGPGLTFASGGISTGFAIAAVDVYRRPQSAGGDVFDVVVTGNTTGLAVVDAGNGTYLVEYTAHDLGRYTVSITLNGTHISGSPWSLLVASPQSTSAPNCVAAGSGLASFVAGASRFIQIEAKDGYHLRRNNTDDVFTATLVASDGGNLTAAFASINNAPGLYSIVYTFTVASTYALSVTLNGSHIGGSPWVIEVLPAALAIASTHVVSPPTRVVAGAEWSFDVQAADQYGNKLTTGGALFNVTIVSAPPRIYFAEDEYIRVADNGNGTYTASLLAFAYGTYTVAVTLWPSVVAVAGSPFVVELDPAPTPQLVNTQFASSGNQLLLEFDSATNRAGFSAGRHPCSGLVTPGVVGDLGVGYTCSWSDQYRLSVFLSSDASILVGGTINVASSALMSARLNSLSVSTAATVGAPTDPLTPTAVLVGPAEISSCAGTTLSLSASTSTGSGSRALQYVWSVTPPIAGVASATADTLSLDPSTLVTGVSYDFSVTVRNFFLNSGTATRTLVKRASPSIPLVTILNSAPVTTLQSRAVTLQASAEFSPCASQRQLQFRWSIDGDTAVPGLVMDRSRLRIPARTLAAGTYLVTLTAQAGNDTSAAAAASVALVVSASAPIASAGSNRQVSTAHEIELDASASNDPDGHTEMLSYAWSCLDVTRSGSPTACVDRRTALPLSLPAQVTVTLPNGTLAAGTYRFTVAVTKPGFSPPSTDTVVVRVLDEDDMPVVTIAGLSEPKISASSRLVLRGAGRIPGGGDVSYQWSETAAGLELDGRTLLTANNGRNLVVRPGALQPDTSYTFRLTSTRARTGRTIGFAEISVLTSMPPSGGSVTVTPGSGFSGQTRFTLTATAWSADARDYPFQYRFSYVVGRVTELSGTGEQFLGVYGYQPTVSLPLAVRTASNVTFIARVMNRWGDVTPPALAYVEVSRPAGFNASQFADDYRQTVLADAVANGNPADASYAVGVVARAVLGDPSLSDDEVSSLQNSLLDTLIDSSAGASVTAELAEMQLAAVAALLDSQPVGGGGGNISARPLDPDVQLRAVSFVASLLDALDVGSDVLSDAVSESVLDTLQRVIDSLSSSGGGSSRLSKRSAASAADVGAAVYDAADTLMNAQLENRVCGENGVSAGGSSMGTYAALADPGTLANSTVSVGAGGSFTFGSAVADSASNRSDGCVVVQGVGVSTDVGSGGGGSRKRSVDPSPGSSLSSVLSMTIAGGTEDLSDGVVVSFPYNATEYEQVFGRSDSTLEVACRYRQQQSEAWTSDRSCEFVGLVGSELRCRCYHFTAFSISPSRKTSAGPSKSTEEASAPPILGIEAIIPIAVVGAVIVAGMVGVVIFLRRRRIRQSSAIGAIDPSKVPPRQPSAKGMAYTFSQVDPSSEAADKKPPATPDLPTPPATPKRTTVVHPEEEQSSDNYLSRANRLVSRESEASVGADLAARAGSPRRRPSGLAPFTVRPPPASPARPEGGDSPRSDPHLSASPMRQVVTLVPVKAPAGDRRGSNVSVSSVSIDFELASGAASEGSTEASEPTDERGVSASDELSSDAPRTSSDDGNTTGDPAGGVSGEAALARYRARRSIRKGSLSGASLAAPKPADFGRVDRETNQRRASIEHLPNIVRRLSGPLQHPTVLLRAAEVSDDEPAYLVRPHAGGKAEDSSDDGEGDHPSPAHRRADRKHIRDDLQHAVAQMTTKSSKRTLVPKHHHDKEKHAESHPAASPAADAPSDVSEDVPADPRPALPPPSQRPTTADLLTPAAALRPPHLAMYLSAFQGGRRNSTGAMTRRVSTFNFGNEAQVEIASGEGAEAPGSKRLHPARSSRRFSLDTLIQGVVGQQQQPSAAAPPPPKIVVEPPSRSEEIRRHSTIMNIIEMFKEEAIVNRSPFSASLLNPDALPPSRRLSMVEQINFITLPPHEKQRIAAAAIIQRAYRHHRFRRERQRELDLLDLEDELLHR